MASNSDDFKGNIFVVEDTPDNLLLITTILLDNGYKVSTAKTGLEAISSILSNPPDLVILDIKMPGIDGFEVCSRIKANQSTSGIPVIFLSALTQIADKQKAFTVGGVDYITKPYNISEVLKRVQIHLENSLLRSQLKQQSVELQLKNELLQKEIAERKLASEKLEESLRKLEEGRSAALNLMDDLKTEIEQRKKTEESALESELRFRGFIENVSDIVYSLSLDGVFTYISPNQPGVIGDFASQALGKQFESYIHPEDVPLCREFLRQILQTKDRVSSPDYKVIQPDGSTRWHSSNGSPLRDKEGNIIGFMGIARDVTERKLAEKAISQSEEKFRKAFLTSPDSININRLSDGLYVQINKGFTQIMGYSEEDAIGKTSLELNIWKKTKDRDNLVKGLKSKAYVENLEAEFIAKNGETKYGLMSAAIMELAGEPHILSITRDITERYQVQEKIRKIGRHYQALIEHAPDGIALINADGKFKFVSPSAKRIFGFEITGEFEESPEKLTHPDDLPFVQSELAKIISDPSYIPTIQYRFRENNGNWKWIESTFTNLLSDSSVEAIIINFRDINERKIAEDALVESERLLRESQSISGLGSYVWNITTGVWKSSVVLDDIFGIHNNYVRSLEGWVNIVHPEWRDIMAQYVTEDVLGKGQRFDMEYKIVRHDNGEERWVHGLGELEKNEIKQVFVLIGTIRDITFRKNTEEQIIRLNAELEERVIKRTAQLEATNKELEAFSYSISHDLRAPLRHINGFINLFLETKTTKLTEEELGYLKTVTNSASEMGRLIDALLTFSRLHRADLQKVQINTNQLIKYGLQFFIQDIEMRKIEVKTGDLHDTYGDLQLIRQVWTNLLSNAIKYTGKSEHPQIEIGSSYEGNEAIFYIRDNGAGFDMKYVDKLFGVFQRLHKPRDFEGVGIGLANVKRIVTRHGGRCWAKGEVGKGAVFYFSLPGKAF
jgi:PAS domain S-box-containing protein